MTDLLCTVCNPALISQGYPEAWCHPCTLAESASDTTTSVMSCNEVVNTVLPFRFRREPYPLPASVKDIDLTQTGLFLAGPAGHGKTSIMARLMRRQIEHAFRLGDTQQPWQFWDHSKLINKLREGSRNGEARRIVQECIDARVVVIDDLGRATPSTYALGCLWEIVNQRYEACMPTSATTNVSLRDLRERLGEALADRLVEDGRYIEYVDRNYRDLGGVEVQTTMTGAEA